MESCHRRGGSPSYRPSITNTTCDSHLQSLAESYHRHCGEGGAILALSVLFRCTLMIRRVRNRSWSPQQPILIAYHQSPDTQFTCSRSRSLTTATAATVVIAPSVRFRHGTIGASRLRSLPLAFVIVRGVLPQALRRGWWNNRAVHAILMSI